MLQWLLACLVSNKILANDKHVEFSPLPHCMPLQVSHFEHSDQQIARLEAIEQTVSKEQVATFVWVCGGGSNLCWCWVISHFLQRWAGFAVTGHPFVLIYNLVCVVPWIRPSKDAWCVCRVLWVRPDSVLSSVSNCSARGWKTA